MAVYEVKVGCSMIKGGIDRRNDNGSHSNLLFFLYSFSEAGARALRQMQPSDQSSMI